MHANKFLHRLLDGTMHKARVGVLTEVVQAVITVKQLNLTCVGRAIALPIQERSGIRKMDRCLGNVFFQEHGQTVYRRIIEHVIGGMKRPVIVVDWSQYPEAPESLLRASLATEGRAITLYEELHQRAGDPHAQASFVKRLKALLPSGCCPILVTDAGFQNPWFKEVLAQGWDYVGRIRGEKHYSVDGNVYQPIKTLHEKAKPLAEKLGEWYLTKRGAFKTHVYRVKRALYGRKCKTKGGEIRKNKEALSYSRRKREPWLLVSSLELDAKKVVEMYAKRMVIEGSFRDMKSKRYGLSLETSKTHKRKRKVVWLLLCALATLWMWVVGREAERQKYHHHFQANSLRKRRVLSFVYLGCQVIRKQLAIPIDWDSLVFFEAQACL